MPAEMFGIQIKYHKVSSVSHFGPAYLRLQWSHATHASIDEEIIVHPTVSRPWFQAGFRVLARLMVLFAAPAQACLHDLASQLVAPPSPQADTR